MKLLYVVNGLGTGGAERSLADMLPGLERAGVEPTIACLYHRAEGVEREVIYRGVDVRFAGSPRMVSRVRFVRSLIDEVHPDIVQTTTFESDLTGRFAAMRTPARVLTSLVNASYDEARYRDPLIDRRKLRIVQAIDGATARHLTDHFHAVSESVKGSAIETLGLRAGDITVVPRGRDPERLGAPSAARRAAARAALDIAPGAEVVINVGRHSHQKGQLDLLDAVATLAGQRPRLVVLIAGRRGPETPALEARIAERGLTDTVRLLWHRDDVPELLAAADVFAFPTLFEGMPGAVIEALALGLPIVASDIPQVREVVVDDRHAVLVPLHDPAALAGAVGGLLDDPDARHAMGERNRQRFDERFTLDRVVDAMVSMYASVVSP